MCFDFAVMKTPTNPSTIKITKIYVAYPEKRREGRDKMLTYRMINVLVLPRHSNVEQRPLWDRVEKLQSRPGSGSSSGSSNSSSQASPGDRFRPRCESPGTVLGYISLTLPTAY